MDRLALNDKFIMDIKLAIVQKVEDCFLEAESVFSKKFIRPKVSFDIRGQDAGRAYFPVNSFLGLKKIQTEIKFNEVLLNNNSELFLQTIVAHECSHLIAYELHGSRIKPHGAEWKNIMENVFRVEAKVTHNLDVSLVSNQPYIYHCHSRCKSEGVALSQRQHNNVMRGSQYLCKKCRSTLLFSFEKELLKNRISSQEKVPKLFLYFDTNITFNNKLADRLQVVLNKKSPQEVVSFPDLSNNKYFKAWLGKNSLLRKYKGLYNPEVLDHSHVSEFSHCIVFTTNKNIQNDKLWLKKLDTTVVIRSIFIKENA